MPIDTTEQTPITPTPESPSPAGSFEERLNALSPEDRTHWRLTGDLPEPKPDATADPSPAKPETSAEEEEPSEAGTVETEPASGPGSENEEPSRKSPRKSWKEVRAEIAAKDGQIALLERQLAQSRKSQPAAEAEEPKPVVTKRPTFPLPEDFETQETYKAAVRKYEEDSDSYYQSLVEERFSREKQSRETESATSTFNSRLEDGRKKYKDFDAVAFNEAVLYSDAMLSAVREHEQFAEISYALGKNMAESKRIAELTHIPNFKELAASNPTRAAFLYGQAKAKAEIELAKFIPSKEAPKPQPRIPSKPSSEVAVNGRAPGDLGDDEAAAIRRGDVEGYKRAANKRELAELKRR
jgi:hypothetical protein